MASQPRMDLASGACVGAEALLRWTHPSLGPISPGEFVPIVEQTSLARQMTVWVLEAALTQLAAWRDAGLRLQLSLNVSAANLMERDFAARVREGLARHQVDAHSLELEVTESATMEGPDLAMETLHAIAAFGVKLAIDDFGTGYSSLAYLQRLPAHVVKIDQSFMRDLLTDPRKQSLVETMVSLSHNLGYRVVAEGVETAEVLDFVRAASCDEGQGYFFSRPMDVRDFEGWFADHAQPQLMAAAG